MPFICVECSPNGAHPEFVDEMQYKLHRANSHGEAQPAPGRDRFYSERLDPDPALNRPGGLPSFTSGIRPVVETDEERAARQLAEERDQRFRDGSFLE